MTTERDESHDHEPMIHPAPITHAEPQRVLIRGGGDGGAAEGVVEHPTACSAVFPVVRPLRSFVPLFGGEWMMAVVSHGADPLATGAAQGAQRLAQGGISGLQHDNPEVHAAMFALPNGVRNLVAG